MYKVATGVATIASIFLLAGCGSSTKQNSQDSSTTSKKQASMSMVKSSKKEAREKVDDAQFSVDNLFEEIDDSFPSEYNYNKLFTGTSVSDVENVEATVDELPQSKDRTRLQKLVAKAMKLAKAEEPSQTVAQSKAEESSLAKYRSESLDKELSSTRESIDEEFSDTKKNSSSSTKVTTSGTAIHYTKVDLETFASETDKYVGKNIETSGEVAYIQKNPDDKDIYYVVILPKDNYTSTGYSFGTVTEINIDSFNDKNIQEGKQITVKGGALTSTLKLNGKVLKSDIVVDSVSVN